MNTDIHILNAPTRTCVHAGGVALQVPPGEPARRDAVRNGLPFAKTRCVTTLSEVRALMLTLDCTNAHVRLHRAVSLSLISSPVRASRPARKRDAACPTTLACRWLGKEPAGLLNNWRMCPDTWRRA